MPQPFSGLERLSRQYPMYSRLDRASQRGKSRFDGVFADMQSQGLAAPDLGGMPLRRPIARGVGWFAERRHSSRIIPRVGGVEVGPGGVLEPLSGDAARIVEGKQACAVSAPVYALAGR